MNNDLKHKILEAQFSNMNAMQKKAIFNVNGPVLILAGAGSGKTTVLVNRIAFMLNYGNAYCDDNKGNNKELAQFSVGECDIPKLKEALEVKPINPWSVLAITFTNKAAKELKDRLYKMLGEDALKIAAGTFHSICLRILRREIDKLEYTSNFTIYDTDDSIRLIRSCYTDVNINDKMFAPKMVLSAISHAKDKMITPDELLKLAGDDYKDKVIATVYKLYSDKLKSANAVDFDDIICLTVKLFMENEDILTHYQNLYKYILVDEYQDTNTIQYKLISLLACNHHNLCVVGDDDQSIYKFRGATIENILNFEKQFKDSIVIRLEQNYRSTQNILNVANAIIKNNSQRKGKNLWTDNGDGAKVTLYRACDENTEALYITKVIAKNIEDGKKFSDHAVLYRMNAQSNSVERGLVKAGIPYKIVGGTKFFERKEIKDILAYMQVIANPHDSVRLKRIINEPKRGIGDTTIKNVEQIAEQLSVPMYEIMRVSDTYNVIAKKSNSLIEFTKMMDMLKDLSLSLSLSDLLDAILEHTEYIEMLKTQGFEGQGRIENIAELKSDLIKFNDENEDATLQGFLEEVSLFSDLDNLNTSEDNVTLMTMHSAKGLEYKVVFVIGFEEGLFPSYQATQSELELEEERRLAYVAVTRAKENLYITHSAARMLFGRTARNMPSRFIDEIPLELINRVDDTSKLKPFSRPTKAVRPHVVLGNELQACANVTVAPICTTIYFEGDRVKHKMFGLGSVVKTTPMSNDTLIEVNFDDVGTKRIMANFAKLDKI